MSKPNLLLVNLDRCIGCMACDIACKQNDLWINRSGNIHVKTLGPFHVDGKLVMDCIPMVSDGCNFCATRLSNGKGPFCVEVCPTKALAFCEDERALELINGSARWWIIKSQI
jgi:sulfur reductase FeS subunit